MLTKADLKAIVDVISPLIDARARTTVTHLNGNITSSEERVSKRIQETKEELRAEILAARAEAKADMLTIDAKLVKRVNSHEKRIDDLEKEVGITNPHKN